jgi:heat shock protein HslJ
MTRRSSSLLAAAAALVLLVAACSSSGASPSSSASPASAGSPAPVGLAGTSWTLADLDGTTPAGAAPTLEFREDGTAGGMSGCNSYNGSYTVDGNTITFGPLISTKMACEQPLMTMESAYLAALQGATAAAVDEDGNLVLSGTATMTFTPG